MPDDAKLALANYLVNAIPEETVVVAPAEPQPKVNEVAMIESPATPTFPDEEMKDLMGKVKRIGMCAKDLHYRAKGKPFYGLHQLADLAFQVEGDTDDLAEVYFLGDRGIEPPKMTEVFERAIAVPVVYPQGDKFFIGGLMDVCRLTMHTIEGIKKTFDVKSGVAAVLDKISEHCLLSIGLLDQTMKSA